MFDRLRNYLREVWLEMGKVTWPTRDELRESTLVVIIASLVVTAFIFVVDRVLDSGVSGLIRLIS
ncbi:MAG: preprotein translocase subunit SecE [Candidatus Latescibacteria bacterium]|nr:preprotein translocase subunit SecE [bacterium]MCB9512926.1 preprotein translocase subunit SecE [Candidatus Latescibacterota bacterium]MCB9516413.1 preprotein translocase subunit SecE [Candidatus Latescibacterota bacterium]